MKSAPLPCHGIYRCQIPKYRYRIRTFITVWGRCTVIKEFDKTYLIEIEEAVGKYLPGDRIKVKKRNVKLSAMDKGGYCYEYDLYPLKESCKTCFRDCAERRFC